ncbi:hypothetical protein C8R44DRAFT_772994 [Mycena epipterygia]|nr:hypothetical protein C8R44DRAFT_772994 [Mycena epipterygia]
MCVYVLNTYNPISFQMSDTILQGSSTALEIRVLLPSGSIPMSPDKSVIPEGTSTGLWKRGVKDRSPPPREIIPPSQLECGGSVEPDSGILQRPFRLAGDFLHCMLSVGSRMVLLILALLSAVLALLSTLHTNFLLLRRPLIYASELEPILACARHCRDEARPFLCSNDEDSNPMPASVLELGRSWERYLEDKIKEWIWCSRVTVFLSAFVLVALQISDKSDPATRVLAYVTFAAMFHSLLVNQCLFPYYLDNKHAKDVHYAYHFLQHANNGVLSMWNMDRHVLLSMSSVSTWWAIVLSTCTFGSIYYHDTKTTGSSEESVPLSLVQMIAARTVMAALLLASGSSLFSMCGTLAKYRDAAEHEQISTQETAPPQDASTISSGSL